MPVLETSARVEPCLLEESSERIADAIAELSAASGQLGARLHSRTAASLAELVRVMNCYYSNLIEGHNTLPRDIERALGGDLDADEARRNLQVEARAHIRVQREIDRLHAVGGLPEPASVVFIRWLHREFYRDAPDAMLLIRGAGREFRMEPGVFRTLPEHEVQVGRHLPPSSEVAEAFMRHFEERYRMERMGMSATMPQILVSCSSFIASEPALYIPMQRIDECGRAAALRLDVHVYSASPDDEAPNLRRRANICPPGFWRIRRLPVRHMASLFRRDAS